MTPDKTCTIAECANKRVARGWCQKHYTRWYETGSTDLGLRRGRGGTPAKPLAERFWPKVDRTSDCWLWTAAKNWQGYGYIGEGGRYGRHLAAHRVAWELVRGPIPDGLQLDHLCRRPECVNPDHLEPVTASENVRRGYSPSLAATRQLAKATCKHGHPYTDENTHITKQGHRICRTCARHNLRARRARLRQEKQ